MSRKYKLFSFLFILLLIFFILGIINVEKKNTSSFILLIESSIPNKIKNILKKTIFSIPTLNKKTEQHETIINELNSKILEIEKKLDHLTNKFELPISSQKKIISKSNNYNIKVFQLPFLNRAEWGGKPAAYLEEKGNNIIVASGSGEFFFLQKKDIGTDNLNLKKIKSNLKSIIGDPKFFSIGSGGIRDLLILDNKILFSFAKEQSSGCYNTSVMISELNYSYLNFSEFFSYRECIKMKTPHNHSGGRISSFKDGKILLTIGEYGVRVLSQNVNSIFGKIISIDLQTKKYEIVAMGSRNAQGLYYDKKNNIILHTDHGPKGGDEININKNPDSEIIENYGWPISSYGEHYDGKFREEAPLHKSHIDYGFVEPIKYFTSSVAISEIVKIPISFNKKFINDFFVGTMGSKSQINRGARSIHHIRFNKNFNKIIFEDIIPVSERIRDIIFIKEKNVVLMILESIPAIGVLNLIN